MLHVPEEKKAAVISRLEAQITIEPNVGCWLWLGGGNPAGYGTISVGRNNKRLAHRVSWMVHRGPIPEGAHVCHRCDVPACVNPDHLFLGTDKDNLRDMATKGRQWNQKKTHCLRGHALVEGNLAEDRLLKGLKGLRVCLICKRAAGRKYANRVYWERKEAAK